MIFPMARIPQCRAYLLRMAYSLDSILALPLRPHGNEHHWAHLNNTFFTYSFAVSIPSSIWSVYLKGTLGLYEIKIWWLRAEKHR